MENSKIKCISCIEQFWKSPISATDVAFLELCTSIEELMKNISTLVKITNSSQENNNNKVSVIFNFNQTISSLQFMSKIRSEELRTNSVLEECRKVACIRIKFCLAMIDKTVSGNDIYINKFGQFLRWMDDALDQINMIDVNIEKPLVLTRLRNTKSIYEDILAHAMSISQICLDEDRKIINGSCRTVLNVLHDLENELTESTPNKAMVSLFVEDVSNKLCALERKVDIAVLRLSLFIFARYCCSLEMLHEFCETNCKKHYNQKDLDNLISDFDLHVDRIFQIGLFAVFCTSNVKSGTNIQNCLASIEFLEPEVVPAMRMILKDCSEVRRASASVYKNYWISEANKLKTLVYEIIDPSAFCKVIYEEITFKVDIITEEYDRKRDFSKSVFVDILNIGKVLNEFLLTVLRIEAIVDAEFKDGVRKCNIIISEIKAALDVLDDNNVVTNIRLLKRCRILQSQVKKLLFTLKKDKEIHDEENNDTKTFDPIPSDQKESMIFSEIMYKGKEILENRSIMYRTPKKCYKTHHLPESSSKSLEFSTKNLCVTKVNYSFQSLEKHSPTHSMNFEDILMNLSKLTSSVQESN